MNLPVSSGEPLAIPRHALFVRVTHWLTSIAVLALLVSGFELVLSHPRFYWGEAGNVNTAALFVVPVPSSRSTVPTGYNYTLPDQNGWSRYLHFQSAWLALFTALVYVVLGIRTAHFRTHLVPAEADRTGARCVNRSVITCGSIAARWASRPNTTCCNGSRTSPSSSCCRR